MGGHCAFNFGSGCVFWGCVRDCGTVHTMEGVAIVYVLLCLVRHLDRAGQIVCRE